MHGLQSALVVLAVKSVLVAPFLCPTVVKPLWYAVARPASQRSYTMLCTSMPEESARTATRHVGGDGLVSARGEPREAADEREGKGENGDLEEDEDEEEEDDEEVSGTRLTDQYIDKLLGSRSLGLDWGHKKIGVALSAGFSQRPLGTIPNVGGMSRNATHHAPTLDRILSMFRLEGADRIVVGMPLYRDGSLSPQANLTRQFATLLANRAVQTGAVEDPDMPFLYLWDERLTSQAARVNIKIKAYSQPSADVDSQAACLVLEDFYAQRGRNAVVVPPAEGLVPPTPQERPPIERPPASKWTTMSYQERREAQLKEMMYTIPQSALHRSDEWNDDEGGLKRKKRKKKKRR